MILATIDFGHPQLLTRIWGHHLNSQSTLSRAAQNGFADHSTGEQFARGLTPSFVGVALTRIEYFDGGTHPAILSGRPVRVLPDGVVVVGLFDGVRFCGILPV